MKDHSIEDIKKQEDKCDYCGSTENVEIVDYEDCMGLATIAICQKCQRDRPVNLSNLVKEALKYETKDQQKNYICQALRINPNLPANKLFDEVNEKLEAL